MKRFTTIVCVIMIALLVFGMSVASAHTEYVTDQEMTFSFGEDERTGRYSGPLENGLAHGRGRFEWANADGDSWVHEGDFVGGAIQGQGTRILQASNGQSESMWIGEFYNGLFHGDVRSYRDGNFLFEMRYVHGESPLIGMIIAVLLAQPHLLVLVIVALLLIALSVVGMIRRRRHRTARLSANVNQSGQAPDVSVPQAVAQKINLNTATEQELTNLPGVGIALAKRAIVIREEIGGFLSAEDFNQRLGLMPHFVVQIENLAFAESNIQQAQPSESAGRVIDI